MRPNKINLIIFQYTIHENDHSLPSEFVHTICIQLWCGDPLTARIPHNLYHVLTFLISFYTVHNFYTAFLKYQRNHKNVHWYNFFVQINKLNDTNKKYKKKSLLQIILFTKKPFNWFLYLLIQVLYLPLT